MQVFMVIAYFVVGCLQFFAVIDGVGHALNIGGFFSFVIALLLTYVPLVGSGLGAYGAIKVWDWGVWQALLLFFWYVPVFIVVTIASSVSGR